MVVVAAGFVMVSLAACQAPPQAEPGGAASAPANQANATVQDLMIGIVDPSSKAVFDAVSSVEGPNGLVEKSPKNDAEWSAVEQNARKLVEAADLLLVPGRPMAVPENAQKHNEGELSPAVIEGMVQKDPAVWKKFVEGFREAGMAAVKAAQAKRKEDFDLVNGDMDTACENCHLHYWYPEQNELFKNEKKPS